MAATQCSPDTTFTPVQKASNNSTSATATSPRVYLNGKLIYTGNNTYMSRDYRYLGTIGLFDSVLLRLQPGTNELWIAVTEAFGGWGVMGRLSDFESVR